MAAEGLSVEEYVNVSETTMEALYDALDAYAEENLGVDLEYSVRLPPPPRSLCFCVCVCVKEEGGNCVDMY